MQRPERLEDQIHFLLSNLIQRELRDPELGFLTLTAVRLTVDRGQARAYFTVLPTGKTTQEEQEAMTRRALGRAAGFLRTELGKRLHMKRVPELKFFPDATLEQGNKMEALLHELEQERAARPASEEAPEGEA